MAFECFYQALRGANSYANIRLRVRCRIKHFNINADPFDSTFREPAPILHNSTALFKEANITIQYSADGSIIQYIDPAVPIIIRYLRHIQLLFNLSRPTPSADDSANVVCPNYFEFWTKDGTLHRSNGLHTVRRVGANFNAVLWVTAEGQLHRTSGPAAIYSDGSRIWFINGLAQHPDKLPPFYHNPTNTVSWPVKTDNSTQFGLEWVLQERHFPVKGVQCTISLEEIDEHTPVSKCNTCHNIVIATYMEHWLVQSNDSCPVCRTPPEDPIPIFIHYDDILKLTQ